MQSDSERQDLREEGRAGGARQGGVWRVLSEEPRMAHMQQTSYQASPEPPSASAIPWAAGCYWQSRLDLLGSL